MYEENWDDEDEPSTSKPISKPPVMPMFKGHKYYKYPEKSRQNKGQNQQNDGNANKRKQNSFRKRFEDAGLMLDISPTKDSPPPAMSQDLREYLDTRKPKRSHCPTRDVESLHKELAGLKESYAAFENFPESHPKYQAEWRTYWNRRCEELTRFGIDTEDYDFKPEWLEFWKRRLKELYTEESEHILKAIREATEREQEGESSWSSDGEPEKKKPPPQQLQPKKPSFPPLPPLSTSSRRTTRSRSPKIERTIGIPVEMPDEVLTITSAMETITNLEDALSRIGPKVIDLVGKSMAMIEGIDLNNFSRSRDVTSVKDKLNGQMLHTKIQSVLKTFENITHILKQMTESPNHQTLSDKARSQTDDPLDTMNDDVKHWMSMFTDVLDNLDGKNPDGRHFGEGSSAAEQLTDTEIEALLQNFDTLSEKEKNHLIMFLKSLEKTDEERVKRLRYFFNGQVNRALSAARSSPCSSRHRRERSRSSSRSYSRSRSWSRRPSRERSRSNSRLRRRPRTPSPLPEIIDNLQMLYQEQFNDPFYSDVIESLKQPHWRAPREVEQFLKEWRGMALDSDSGALKVNVRGNDVYVIPDRIKVDVIMDFHRKATPSGKKICRTRAETVSFVTRYCFIPGLQKIVNHTVDKCKYCRGE
ncbi:uncharacterized protein LOC132255743 [Phlebotomus argentipes]|uniref:uncharacterized protein LOC132255743 n=1 Tax=Phlebotomus argentipes TaxID=94469 RepID=UPI0028936D89|nr:uncharacterized protein LOC132255743 [Phlebotomus argentipes]XP_059607869.1 uncharacterized protein LOC132255743 [Phlebotomus argentipes]